MTEERFAQLELQLRAATDNIGRLMDIINKKGFVPAFVCGHSGLLLPGDWVKEWGRKYGIGLGRSPVSDVLDTDYDTAPPDITPRIRRIEQIMHPVHACRAQVDLVMVSPEEYEARRAVLEGEDRLCTKRAGIVYQRQLENPRSRLPVMRAKWKGA